MAPIGLIRARSTRLTGLLAAMLLITGSRTVQHALSDPATRSGGADSADLAASTMPSARPLLEEFNRETRSLFTDIAGSIVRVELPAPPQAGMDDLLAKWQLDPQFRQQLGEMQRRSPGNSFVRAEIQPATSPSTESDDQDEHVIVMQLTGFAPNAIGIVIDDQRHLLIPAFMDKSAGDLPIPVILGDGRMTTATFVASDRLADLTVLQLHDIAGKPAILQPGRPADGTLLLVMSLNPALNRLAVWQGSEPDLGCLVTVDAKVAGFTKGGEFFSAATYQPAVTELIEHGVVRRAVLGVLINTIGPNDPQRAADSALGVLPAIRVKDVADNSAAQHGGLQPGDVILTLGSESIGDAPTFAAAIANRRGETKMTVLRNGQRITITVDLQVQNP